LGKTLGSHTAFFHKNEEMKLLDGKWSGKTLSLILYQQELMLVLELTKPFMLRKQSEVHA